MTHEEEVIKNIADKLACWFGHPLGYNSEFFYNRAKQILSIPELLIKDPDQSLPTDKVVNISFKAKPELTMPAQIEIGETAIIAYTQAQRDMREENWIKVLKEEK